MLPLRVIWGLVRLLVNSCLFISLAALSFALQTYLLQGNPLLLTPLAILIFFATLFIYNWQRMLSNKKRLPYAAPGMHQWIQSNTWWPRLAMTVSVVAMAVCVTQLSKPVIIGLIALGLISFAYALPIPVGGGVRLRIRDLGLFKPFVLGLVWGFATALLPMLDMGVYVFSHDALFIIGKRVLFVSAICIPFDIKDMEFDRHTMRYPTIPLLVGEKYTHYITLFVLLLFQVLVFIHNGLSPVGLALTASNAYTIAMILYPNPRHSEYYYTLGIDSTILVQFLLVLIAVRG